MQKKARRPGRRGQRAKLRESRRAARETNAASCRLFLFFAAAAQNRPFDVGAQFFAAHRAVRGALDRWAIFGGGRQVWIRAVKPVENVRLLDATPDRLRGGGLPTDEVNCFFEGFESHVSRI